MSDRVVEGVGFENHYILKKYIMGSNPISFIKIIVKIIVKIISYIYEIFISNSFKGIKVS